MTQFLSLGLLLSTLALQVQLKHTQLPECELEAEDLNFPEDFIFGAATASYQIEGGYNVDGKGPSIWDTLTSEHPERILDRSNGNIAADSYHKYMEDVKALNDTGVKKFMLDFFILMSLIYSLFTRNSSKVIDFRYLGRE